MADTAEAEQTALSTKYEHTNILKAFCEGGGGSGGRGWGCGKRGKRERERERGLSGIQSFKKHASFFLFFIKFKEGVQFISRIFSLKTLISSCGKKLHEQRHVISNIHVQAKAMIRLQI